MKKLMFLGAVAAMLLGTASCSSDMEPEMTGDGNVQFTIELPGAIESRTISDGLTATKLQVAVYKEDGTLLQNVSLLGDKAVTMTDRKATVNFKLVKGMKYSFAFWAQNPDEDAYTFDATTGKVTVDYSKAVANADDGDAFSNREMNLEITGPINKTITLTRPFAQLNYGDVVSDYEAAVEAGIDIKQTVVTVKQVANQYDILNQTTTGTNADITWAAANSVMSEDLKVDEDTYKWLSMCYFLVPNDEATVTTELSMLNTAGAEFNKLTVESVPVKKNHRTNILGNLFTEDVNFNVIIDQRFDQPDNNIEYPEVTNVVTMNGQKYESIEAAYNSALEAGLTDIVMTLAKGTYTMDNNFAFENQNKVINVTVQAANGVSPADITVNGRFAMSASSAQKVATGSSMTIKGLTLTKTTNTNTKGDATHYYRSGSEVASIYIFGGVKLIVEDCVFNIADSNGKATGIVTWGDQATTAVVKNCTFNCEGNAKPLQIGNGSSNTIEGCTFNQPKKYAVQVNHYTAANPASQLIFKNNIVNANPSKVNYGLALDSRQEAYYNLNITVENNVMNDAVDGSYLYAHSDAPAIWETVTVNNSRDEWGIYKP